MVADEQGGWNSAWQRAALADELATLRYPHVQPALRLLERHLPDGALVLEAGCGPGRILYWLAEKGHRTVGVDVSLSALRMAREGLGHTEVALADVRRLPLPDSAFDVYLSFGVVEHFPDGPDAALAEAFRVLKPGGTIIVSVPHVNVLARLDPPLKALYRKVRRIQLPEDVRGEPPGRYYRRAELRDAVRRQGFAIVQVAPLGHAYALHAFCSLFRKKGAYHDVTGFGVALGNLLARIAPWSTAFMVFVVGHKPAIGAEGGDAIAARY